ncbi:MAG: hypothetical protein ABWY16_15025, partial [Pedobacter sp.]|uniref:hypothetical protein n=1 Tax=Pedobacter sp. TaxID=1411316 RepID=UPI003393FA6A
MIKRKTESLSLKWSEFKNLTCLALLTPVIGVGLPAFAQKIDRHALVTRHNLHITDKQSKGPTQVGNGHFAFGFDFTGLQTFNDDANTMSDWGWHKFILPKGDPYQYKGHEWDTQGRQVRYDVHNEGERDLYKWMRANPQRLNLGRLGFIFRKKDGTVISLKEIQNGAQDLDMWTGVAVSTFNVEGKAVKVTTVGDPNRDAVAVKIQAPALNDGQILVELKFPYASNEEFSNGADFNSPDRHTTAAQLSAGQALFHRQLDSTQFDVRLNWKGGAKLAEKQRHEYLLSPAGKNSLELVLEWDNEKTNAKARSFDEIKAASIQHWQRFWQSGGAIDLSQSKDTRWKELERRIVLSEYLMAVNESGQLPPQESGLVNNGWYGKYHFEMIWWHAAHYALWGRLPQMDNLTSIYRSDVDYYAPKAKEQGYAGVRWPKTLGGRERWEWPNETNPLLIWQQPHPIFFAELEYRSKPTKETLDKWKDVVIKTADFMASYPVYNKREKRYILGYPLQVVSENANQHTTINPVFELSYWRTGLRLALEWEKRLGMPVNKKYEEVLAGLSALPEVEGKYVSWENIYHMWSVYNFEHPALIGAYGMLPGDGVDKPTMDRTLTAVEKNWKF